MKYVLITVKNITDVYNTKTKILTKTFPTKERAYNAMKTALYNRIKIDKDKLNNSIDKYIEMLENGSIYFSNMELKNDSAYIYQNCGETYYQWKIIEI